MRNADLTRYIFDANTGIINCARNAIMRGGRCALCNAEINLFDDYVAAHRIILASMKSPEWKLGCQR